MISKPVNIKILVLFLLIFTLVIPTAVGSAAVNAKKESATYVAAVSKLVKYEQTALELYEKYQTPSASTRKAADLAFTKSIVPNYQKFVSGLKAIKSPTTPELLKLHKMGVNAAAKQLNALINMNNAIHKNPMDKTSLANAKKTLSTTIPDMKKWANNLGIYNKKLASSSSDNSQLVTTLPLTVDADEVVDLLRTNAYMVIQSFAEAIKSGDTKKMDDLLKKMINPEANDGNGMDLNQSLKMMDTKVSKYIANYDTDELNKWLNAILNSKALELVPHKPFISDDSLSITFHFELPDYNIGPFVYINMLKKDGVFVINAIWAN
ncbi:hypothetical protein [Cohnella yongneupensis]|uniref:DUF3887 domain-containing protein n=1 Tax=Cohnella yongneupensis TaxID=425006 RepID=A0ABW0RAG7_9BACL